MASWSHSPSDDGPGGDDGPPRTLRSRWFRSRLETVQALVAAAAAAAADGSWEEVF